MTPLDVPESADDAPVRRRRRAAPAGATGTGAVSPGAGPSIGPPDAGAGREVRAGRRGSTRAALVRCGTQILTERGFLAMGIDEVLKKVGVPKGSFYHYFDSKQAFGEAVIDDYAQYFYARLDCTLGDTGRPPLERLAAFVEEAQRGMARHRFQRGCLIGNLGQEVGVLGETFRGRLESVLLAWQARTAVCLREAVVAGDVSTAIDVEEIAEFFWIGWEGAVLRARLARDSAPMALFSRVFFARVLG